MSEGSGYSRRTIATDAAPAAIGPYSQAVLTTGGRTLYLSGQISLDPKTGKLVEGGVDAQTKQVLENLEAVLAAAGMTFAHLVKCGIFLADMADFGVVNELYAQRFSGEPPARATVQVACLPKGVAVEIDGVAVAP
ncbi:MAG: RidA family protein [Nannocystaceae bacterium]